MLLLIDNYDSFVFNLARYFERLGQTTHVLRNTALDVDAVQRLEPAALVLSPGPCSPQQAGCSLALVRAFCDRLPILGICLGHQILAEALGGKIVRASEPVHGRASSIYHEGQGVFVGLPSPITAGRYHSLVVDEVSLPHCLQIDARTADGTIMAVSHHERPIVGLQFHPESILTEYGYRLLAAFLAMAGIGAVSPLPDVTEEFTCRRVS